MPPPAPRGTGSLAPNARPTLAAPLTGSILLHGVLIGLFFLLRPTAPPASAPVYRVDLVAARRKPEKLPMLRLKHFECDDQR